MTGCVYRIKKKQNRSQRKAEEKPKPKLTRASSSFLFFLSFSSPKINNPVHPYLYLVHPVKTLSCHPVLLFPPNKKSSQSCLHPVTLSKHYPVHPYLILPIPSKILPPTTIKSYYQILEDMFVGFTVPAFSGSPHKSALTTPRFFFFDNGVRNAAADIPLVESSVNTDPGYFFEHWVAGQLWRELSYTRAGTLLYYRTSDGAEVDFVVQTNRELIPIEVKWTDHPRQNDTRHLKTFIAEQSSCCARGYLVSRCPYVLDLGNHITAIPWWMI